MDQQTVSVHPGEEFAITLDAQPGTGYSWTISSDPDPGVAIALAIELLPPRTPLPGAPQQACFRFAATGAGQTSVGFAYARPFEPDAEPAQRVEVVVIVSRPQVPVQLPPIV